MSKKRQSFVHSVSCAFDGILSTFVQERNFKIMSAIAVFVLVCGFLLKLDITTWIVLILLIGVILAGELVNTAIEAIVDLVTDTYHPLAKKAKDAAAGAQLLLSFLSIIIGILILIQNW